MTYGHGRPIIISLSLPDINMNWFPTLNAALESEGLIDSWKMEYPPIGYDTTANYTWDNGTKHGHFVSIYRDGAGRYERPVHYDR